MFSPSPGLQPNPLGPLLFKTQCILERRSLEGFLAVLRLQLEAALSKPLLGDLVQEGRGVPMAGGGPQQLSGAR